MSILPTNNQKRSGSRFRTIFIVSMAMLVATSVFFAFAQASKHSQTQRLVSLSINKGTLNQKPTSVAASESEGAEVGVSFSFTAAGDYGQTSHTDTNLNYIAKAGVNFNLAIGD